MFDIFQVHVEVIQRHRTACLKSVTASKRLEDTMYTSPVLEDFLKTELRGDIMAASTFGLTTAPRSARVRDRAGLVVDVGRKLVDVDIRRLLVPTQPVRILGLHDEMRMGQDDQVQMRSEFSR